MKQPSGELEKIIITPDVADVRPIVMGAVLRNVTFTEASYESFIDLQDKLHQNLARRRTLASIGTHDLDTVKEGLKVIFISEKSSFFLTSKGTIQIRCPSSS